MNRINTSFIISMLLLVTILSSSCATTKDVAYLQIADRQMQTEAKQLQDARIMPKDILTVNIQASQAEVVAAFNGLYWNPQQQYNVTQTGMRTYLVDNDGTIDLPVLGRTALGGATLREAEDLVKKELTTYLNEVPSVNIKIENYRYAVLGEVRRPGAFEARNSKVNIFEALANAGDMTMYGIRDSVRVLRANPDGSSTIVTLDLKDPNVVNSPYYQLQQGDVVYVVPNDAIAASSNISAGTTIWISIASIGLTVANLLVTLLR